MNQQEQYRRAIAIIATLRLDLGWWTLLKLLLKEAIR